MYLPSGRKLKLPKEISMSTGRTSKKKIIIFSVLYMVTLQLFYKLLFMNLVGHLNFLYSPSLSLLAEALMSPHSQRG